MVENLPGLPDNIRLGDDGLSLWVATPALRNTITNMINEFPIVRGVALNKLECSGIHDLVFL